MDKSTYCNTNNTRKPVTIEDYKNLLDYIDVSPQPRPLIVTKEMKEQILKTFPDVYS